MPRNLDMTSLRSFVAVADAGGVTKAAGLLNLTQSAVSMQLKRLEEALDATLLDRSARTVGLTSEGEQLLSYARRMLSLNDEAYGKLTSQAFQGEVRLGVPHDIVYPAIPQVLRKFTAAYPRVKVHLVSSFTRKLLQQLDRGEVDMILTTEDGVGQGGEVLQPVPLVWVGAPGGRAWRDRPLRLAFEESCIFRQFVQRRLDQESMTWDMAVQSGSTRAIEATVSADLAVTAMLEGTQPAHFEVIPHAGQLPSLREMNINLYSASTRDSPVLNDLSRFIREGFLTI